MHDKDTSNQVLSDKDSHWYPIKVLVIFRINLVQVKESCHDKGTQSFDRLANKK